MEKTDKEFRMDEQEQEIVLSKQVNSIENMVNSIVIMTDEDFAYAGEVTKNVKNLQKEVEAYWEPIYTPAYAAYKRINEHKKAMLDPLKNGEKILKGKISAYLTEKERKKREEEARLRKLAAEEAERKLKEAAKAEMEGDMVTAEDAMMEAEAYETISMTTVIPNNAPKAKGISTSKTWRAEIVDTSKIPMTFNGVPLWTVNEKAIRDLVKAYKGNIEIPGVKIIEEEIVSVRTA